MASTTFSATSWYDFDFGTRRNSVSVNDGNFVAGTTITFYNTAMSDTSILFSGLSSALWTNSANFTLGANSSTTRTLKADATLGSAFIYCTAGGDLFSGQFTIISGVDSTPDAFSLGADKDNQQPNIEVYFPSVVVSGISGTTVQANATNMHFMYSGDTTNTWRTALAVSNGARLYCKAVTPSGYGQTKNCTLTIGGVSDTVLVSTSSSPNQGTYVPFPTTTLPISLNDVIQFFGGSPTSSASRSMLMYKRGGTYVPDIPQNSGLPNAAPINLSDFLGTGTTFYFVVAPASKSASANTINAAQSLALQWTANASQGWSLGYSPSMTTNAQYRYVITENTSANDPTVTTGVTITPSTYATWSTNNSFINIAASSNQATERSYRGTITMYARSQYDPTIETSETFNYALMFFGV